MNSPPGSVRGVAASSLVRGLLTGPSRRLDHLATFRSVGYLAAGETVLALLTGSATRLPSAVLVTGALPDLTGGAVAGEGALTVGVTALRVARWWTPPRPGPVCTGATYDEAVGRLAALRPATGAGAEPERVAALAAALGSPGAADLVAAIRGLVGRGPGLTPSGDDVLAGALLALHGTAAASRLAAALDGQVRGRTTLLSAQLLGDAAAGYGTPEAVALVDAVRGHGSLAAALDRLRLMGHTSGADTALGILVGAQALPMAGATHRREEIA